MSQSRPPARRNEYKPPHTAATLVSGMTAPCCYCNQMHVPTNCYTVTTVEARRQSLLETGRCFLCLRRSHIGRDCKSTSRCRTCNGCHHTSICHRSPARNVDDHRTHRPQSSHGGNQPSGTGSPTTPPTSRATATTPSTLNPGAPTFASTPTSTASYVDTHQTVLLQTALVEVRNPLHPSRRLKLRIVMDNGSQRSYLTQRVKEVLGSLHTKQNVYPLQPLDLREESQHSVKCYVLLFEPSWAIIRNLTSSWCPTSVTR